MNSSFREKESGVSPVIGVMLMIVVTVIIAAVVSGFAGGLTDSSTDVPVASFEWKIYEYYQFGTVHGVSGQVLEGIMKSGAPIDTGDLKIVSYHEDADGNLVSHVFTQSPHVEGAYNYVGSFRIFAGVGSDTFFGEKGAIWHTGDKFTGGADLVLGMSGQAGDQVQIDVVYEPTNTVICSQVVTVI